MTSPCPRCGGPRPCVTCPGRYALLWLLFFLWVPTTLQAKPQDNHAARIEAAVAVGQRAFPRADLSTWKKAKVDADNVEAIFRQLAVHSQRFPQVARSIDRIECSDSGLYGTQVAVCWNDGHQGLTRIRFKHSWLKSDRSKAPRTASHEFGHAVDHYLRFETGADVDGFKRDALKNKKPRSTVANEEWAECFKEWYWEKPKARRIGSAKVMEYLDRVLPEVP